MRSPARSRGVSVPGSGFRVQSSGFRFQSSEFRVQGSGCMIRPLLLACEELEELKLRFERLSFGVQDVGYKVCVPARPYVGGRVLYEKRSKSKPFWQ